MVKKMLIILLFILLIFNLGCSKTNSDIITAGVVSEVSSLILHVKNENGSSVGGANVYVNRIFKGTTSKFGQGKGTKTIVLKGDKNIISVEKNGFLPSEPETVSASFTGQQRLTVVLETYKTDLEVKIRNNGKYVEDAMVILRNEGGSAESIITNEKGRAVFKQVNDGSYSIITNKQNYKEDITKINISHDKDGGEVNIIISLVKLPELIVEVVDAYGFVKDSEVSFYGKREYNSPGKAMPVGTRYTNNNGLVKFTSVNYDQRYVVVVKKQGYEAEISEIKLIPENEKIQVLLVRES